MFKKKSGEPFSISDFMLWKESEPEKYASVDDVFRFMKQVASGAQKDGE